MGQSDRSWEEKMADPSVNFYEVQETFRQQIAGKETEKGKGFKAFKRWEWFMEPRVYPAGERFPADAVMRAMEERPEMFVRSGNGNGEWVYIGNTGVPSSGGGAGRVNSVRTATGSALELYACAPGGGLWKTVNGGVSWSIMNTDFLASIGVSDVAVDPSNPNILYIATGDGDAGDTYSVGVLKSTDGGQSWSSTGLSWTVTQARTTNRILIHPTNPSTLIVATSNGLYRTTNAGVSWSQVQTGNFKDLIFKPGDPSVVYACTNRFYRSTNGGATWSLVSTNLPTSSQSSRLAVAVSNANPDVVYVLAGGSDQGFFGLYRSTDSGVTFTTQSNSPNILGWSSQGSDSGGQAWFDLRLVADPNNANIIYSGGVNVWKSTNGGVTWSCNAHWYGAGGLPYVHADIHAMYFVPGTSTLLIGCDGGVFRTTNGGSSYTDISSNLEIGQQYRLGISTLNSNLILTGWQDNGTNRKSGNSHSRVIGGDGMECAIDPTSNSIMYGELYYGNIVKSTNGGNSFGITVANSGGTAGTVHENGAWVTPFVLGSNPQHIFVGKTRVYRSTNGGNSFTALGAIGSGTVRALAVAPSNNNVIYASKGSTLYKSTDGSSFSTVTGLPNHSITYIAVHATDPNKVWITYSGFTAVNKVYFTSNGGSSWTNLTGNLPNLPVNCVVHSIGTNDGVYVGTDAGVFYRDNELGNWIPYMNGLPRVVVSELEIHYGSSTITAATYGRGTWRAPLFSVEPFDAVLVNILSPSGNSCTAQLNPQLLVQNAGSQTISSLLIYYAVSGQVNQSIIWTGSIAPGQTSTISLPTLNYGVGAFSFSANIVQVNGQVDGLPSNNSQTVSYTVSPGPVNDVCAQAIPLVVNDPEIITSNANSCLEGPEPTCGGTGIRDVWYSFVYSGGTITIETTLGSNSDTRLALYAACGGSQLACNDDASGIGLASRIVMACGTLNIGQTYYVQAGGSTGITGTFGIRVSSNSLPNDLCSGALPVLEFGVPISVSTSASCLNGVNPSCGGSQIQDAWFRFVYTGGSISISTSGPGTLTDPRIAVYAGCGGTMIACDDDDGPGTHSLIQFGCTPGDGVNGANEATVLVPGQTYYIQAGGYNGLSGTFQLLVSNGAVAGCTNALACNYFACANTDDGSCVSQQWYYADADGDGFGNPNAAILSCDPVFGYVSNGLDCADNNPDVNPLMSELCNGQDDNCDGFVDEGCTPQNDEPETASGVIPLPLGTCQNLAGTVQMANPSSSLTSCANCADVWYYFEASSRGVRIVCEATTFNARIELYSPNLELLASENSSDLIGREVMHYTSLIEGQVYLIRISSASSVEPNGNFTLCINSLEKSQCDMGLGPFSLCQSAKAKFVGAQVYGFRFISQSGQGISTGQTIGGSTLLRLDAVSGLRYGHTYTLLVDAGYLLPDASGNPILVWVSGNQPCLILTSPTPEVVLRVHDRCPEVRALNQQVALNTSVCGAVSYVWEFSQSDNGGGTMELPGIGSTRFISINTLSGFTLNTVYQVRAKSIFDYGESSFGSPACLQTGSGGQFIDQLSEFMEEPEGTTKPLFVSPNPNDGNSFTLLGSADLLEGILEISLRDAGGRLVQRWPSPQGLTPGMRIPLVRKPEPGVYFLEIRNVEGLQIERFVVIR